MCDATYQELAAAGFDVAQLKSHDAEALAAAGSVLEADHGVESAQQSAESRLAPLKLDRPQSYYSAWLDFYLYNNSHCTNTIKYNAHCGWLYHKYTCSSACPQDHPQGTTYTTAFPARSGNNAPANDWVVGMGPIPNEYTWRWGYMNGVQTGYESDGGGSFSPGKWRLDPWSVTHNGVTRGAFEIHGGRDSHDFWNINAVTGGRIRLPQPSITSLKSHYNTLTSNKTSAYLHIY